MAGGYCAAGIPFPVVPQMTANGPGRTRAHPHARGQNSLSERVGIPGTRICRKFAVGSGPWTRECVGTGGKASNCTSPRRNTWHASRASTCQFRGKPRCKPALSRMMNNERSPVMASTGPISNADSAIAVDNSPAPGRKPIGGIELKFRGFPAVPVRIANNAGEKLLGQLIEAGTTDINILCHGFRSSMNGFTVSTLTAALVEKGLTAFRFDFSGNGLSEGSFEYGNFAKEVEDLRAVIEYWRRQGRKVSSIIGHSKGGDVVILYAAKYDDVPKVVNVSGRFQMDRGLTERFGEDGLHKLKTIGYLDVQNDADAGNVQYRVTLASLEERLATDMKAAAEAIHKSRVMTVHGSNDAVVPVEDGRSFAQSIQFSHKLVILEGASHRYTEHTSELSSAVLDFLSSDQE